MRRHASEPPALINVATSAMPAAEMPHFDKSMEERDFETDAAFPNAMMLERSRSYFHLPSYFVPVILLPASEI